MCQHVNVEATVVECKVEGWREGEWRDHGMDRVSLTVMIECLECGAVWSAHNYRATIFLTAEEHAREKQQA